MKIIKKYYDKQGKLRILKDKNNQINSIIRFKVLRNGKEFPCCDFEGRCTNIAYAEVYPCVMKKGKKKGWSYLCRKHYFEEQKRLKWKLPACLKVEW
ncbi:hypothetical protein CMI37_38220 [Candidatus Pacearchaeota archaeon]|nr:hypothetical protein [Candidatus Pacearchaeota archaeon]